MGTRISDLPSAGTFTGAELVPVTQSGVTVKATSSQFKTTNASELISGTLGAARLPAATNLTQGAVVLGSTAGSACEGNDTRLSNSRIPTGAAAGDLAGTYPNPTLSTTGAVAGTYGDNNSVPQIQVDIKGRILSVSSVPIAGTAGGTVTSVNVSGGTTGLTTAGGPVVDSGVITLAGTLAVANGGTGATTASVARTNLSAASSGTNTDITSIALTTGTITTPPSGTSDIVNKAYADSIGSGINFHDACDYGTIAALFPTAIYNQPGGAGVGVNATLTGNANTVLQVDGVTVSSGKRILVKNQSAPVQNGVYTVSQQSDGSTTPYILTRASDYDTSGSGINEVQAGDFILLLGGTLTNTAWVQQTPAPIIFGTTSIVFTQFSGAASGVSTFSGGTTGLTPNTPSTGTITLAGTLAVANGGTGVTTSTGTGAVVLGTSPTISSATVATPTINGYTEGVVAIGAAGASQTLSITAGTVITATLTSATPCTFTMPTAVAGKAFTLYLKQPVTGTATTATFTGVKWAAATAPVITAAVGKMDILSFVSDGTNWYGSFIQNFTY
jgi:hypothetical protein